MVTWRGGVGQLLVHTLVLPAAGMLLTLVVHRCVCGSTAPTLQPTHSTTTNQEEP